jgi:hypothetical protein
MRERTDWGELLEVSEDNLPANAPGADRRRSPDW